LRFIWADSFEDPWGGRHEQEDRHHLKDRHEQEDRHHLKDRREQEDLHHLKDRRPEDRHEQVGHHHEQVGHRHDQVGQRRQDHHHVMHQRRQEDRQREMGQRREDHHHAMAQRREDHHHDQQGLHHVKGHQQGHRLWQENSQNRLEKVFQDRRLCPNCQDLLGRRTRVLHPPRKQLRNDRTWSLIP
jgi:hypothetical protein